MSSHNDICVGHGWALLLKLDVSLDGFQVFNNGIHIFDRNRLLLFISRFLLPRELDVSDVGPEGALSFEPPDHVLQLSVSHDLVNFKFGFDAKRAGAIERLEFFDHLIWSVVG